MLSSRKKQDYCYVDILDYPHLVNSRFQPFCFCMFCLKMGHCTEQETENCVKHRNNQGDQGVCTKVQALLTVCFCYCVPMLTRMSIKRSPLKLMFQRISLKLVTETIHLILILLVNQLFFIVLEFSVRMHSFCLSNHSTAFRPYAFFLIRLDL